MPANRFHPLVHSALLTAIACCLLAPIGVVSQTKPASATPKRNGAAPKKSKNGGTFILVGAGDIASCKSLQGAEATANLIEGIPGEVFADGDLAYEKGTAEELSGQRAPTLPLPPLLTPMAGCWARLISIEGCAGCEVEPLGAPDTPTPVEAGGVTTELPPVMPVLPAPTGAPAPAEPDVWAWAIETTEATHTRAVAKVLIILIPPRV
jgi:hypothetical protein